MTIKVAQSSCLWRRWQGVRGMKVYSIRGQGVLLVLYSLRELAGACTKQEVLMFIQHASIYDITKHDLPPYENQNEPRYHTLLSWARKDAVELEWMLDTGERDAWQLTRHGREVLERTILRFRRGELSVRKCYLWTPKFKKQIDPGYEPSTEDSIRPEEVFDRLIA